MADFPTTPKPNSVRITSIAQTNLSVSHSLRTIVSDRGGHRWAFGLSFPPMSRAAFAPLWAFIVSQRGRFGTFNLTLPGHAAQGSMAGTPVVQGDLQTGRLLYTRGWTASRSGVLRAGDFIRIAGSYKAHMVVADVDSDSGGLAAISIEPALYDQVADGSAIAGDGVFRCALTDDMQGVDVSLAAHYGFSVDLIEVLV